MKPLTRSLSALSALLLGGGLLSAPVIAIAAEPDPASDVVMDEFLPSDYIAEAAQFDAGLVGALARDLGLTPEEYLAESAAALQGVEVVSALEASGVTVLASRMEGTDLVVNVPSSDLVPVVEAAGALAELGEPVDVWSAEGLVIEPAEDLYNGQGWLDTSTWNRCSVGLNGYLVATGAPEFATAGHCTHQMTSAAVAIVGQVGPNDAGVQGATIGSVVAGTSTFGDGFDIGRIAVGAGVSPQPSVLTWGGGTGAPLATAPLALTGDTAPIMGAPMCKSGQTTGWTCGTITAVDQVSTVGTASVRAVVASLCVLPGDSGGIGMIGSKAVGITSWYARASGGPPPANPTCADVVSSGFFQTVSRSGQQSVQSAYGATWEMAATVSAPVVQGVVPASDSTTMTGQVPNAGRNYAVDVFLDGASTPVATATVNQFNGTWSVPLPRLAVGLHQYTAVARYGTWSKSTSTAGVIEINMTMERLAGADRYETAAAIAAEFDSASTVFIASGENYPDALSAAPAAGAAHAPLLLTTSTSMPASIVAQLERLAPSRVVIVGMTGVVADSVLTQIQTILPDATIDRVGGADRYATSLAIVEDAFPSSTVAYVATGADFPDALSAASAAGSRDAPVILVSGKAASIDAATAALIESLGVTTVYIAGGAAVVSPGIESAIDALPGVAVERLAGADRFETSAVTNRERFSTATGAYLATGLGFADALAGAALAGSTSSPLFVTPGTCVSADVLDAIADLIITRVTLLGSTGALSEEVLALEPC